jgi:DNA invertase Pin-like site-specific DNA recombinase
MLVGYVRVSSDESAAAQRLWGCRRRIRLSPYSKAP